MEIGGPEGWPFKKGYPQKSQISGLVRVRGRDTSSEPLIPIGEARFQLSGGVGSGG